MFGAVQTSSPVRVQVDSRHSTTDDFEALALALVGAGRVLLALLLLVWRAPALALVAGASAVAGWAVAVGYGLPVLAAALALATLVAVVVWRRPGWAGVVGSLMVGQWLRVVIYRPRWETACLAARTAVRLGNRVHVPGLLRHKHTPGLDVLTVRSAPGQTLADWQGACPSLASTFSAHSVSAREGLHPGWVVLDVLRRDPLAAERVAPNPARALIGSGDAVTLGRDEHGRPVQVSATGTAHMAIQGATRSGKSSATYTLLAALAHRPDVLVAGIDPTGVLLSPFTAGPGAPYIATGTRADDLEHAADVLDRLVVAMDSRVRDLLTSGADKITTFSASLPALWVVLEEFPGLLAAARALDAETAAKGPARIAPRLERALGRLVKEGAKVGVTVLVLAQRMSANALDTDDRANIAVRVTLRVDNGDAVAMLHDGLTRDGIDKVRQFAPGVAVMEAPGTPARRVRFHYTDYPTYRRRVTDGLAATATAPRPVNLDGSLSGAVIRARAAEPTLRVVHPDDGQAS